MKRRRALLVAALLVAWGCAIQPDAGPREIPVDERAPLDPVAAGAGESEGTSRVFLLAEGDDEGERLLRSVPRDVDSTPKAVLEELIKGPNPSEEELGIRTAIPSDLTLWSALAVAGTLNVDVSSEILDLPSTALRYAVAEIVYTASELDGVDAVRLRVDGEIRAWPDGSSVAQTAPLTVYDFPGMAESAQPPYPAEPTELAA